MMESLTMTKDKDSESADSLAKAREIVTRARRAIYALLSEDDEESTD